MQGTVAKKQSSFRDKMAKITGSDIFSAIVPLIILIVLATIFNPNFISLGNFISMFNLIPFVAICCLGNALVIMTGSADISVGKTSGLAAIIFGWTIKVLGVPIWLAVILGILTGGLIGSSLSRRMDNAGVDKLFLCLLIAITGISIYNLVGCF